MKFVFALFVALCASTANAADLLLPQRVADAVANDLQAGSKAKNCKIPLDMAIKHRHRIIKHLDTNEISELLIYLLLTN